MREYLQKAMQEANSIGKQVQQLTAQLNGKGREVSKTQDKLTEQSESQGKAKMFGNAVPQILQKIQQTRFNQPVLGPIGMCITMKEGMDQWAQAVEKSLISQLRTFVVSNSEDRAILSAILKTFNGAGHH